MNDSLKYFEYGPKQVAYLKGRDSLLGDVIDRFGHLDREVDADLFGSIIHKIVGQQISRSAQRTVWKRIKENYGDLVPVVIASESIVNLQAFGITFKKAGYIQNFAKTVSEGRLNLDSLHEMTDSEVIELLVEIPGLGRWTAEMVLLFGMQRSDVFSFGDIAIHRGLKQIYGYEKVTQKIFEKHRKIYSPYCSVASLYIWHCAVPE